MNSAYQEFTAVHPVVRAVRIAPVLDDGRESHGGIPAWRYGRNDEAVTNTAYSRQYLSRMLTVDTPHETAILYDSMTCEEF